jgi:CheY-like chemotaxis protein
VPLAPSRPRLRILVADGDRAVLTILRHGLEDAGAEVVSAGDGTSALRQLVDHLLGLDLLVTGLELPVLDGRSLVRIVRAEGGETELPIMVLAATVTPQDRELLAHLGVTEIVEKHQGSVHAVRRAVALAAAAHDRRVEALGPEDAPIPVPIGRLAPAHEPVAR